MSISAIRLAWGDKENNAIFEGVERVCRPLFDLQFAEVFINFVKGVCFEATIYSILYGLLIFW